MPRSKKNGICLKTLSLVIACLFLVNNITWAAGTDTLSPQHIFSPLKDEEIQEIGFLKAAIKYNLIQNENLLDGNKNRAIRIENNPRFHTLELKFAKKEIMRDNGYLVPCVINRGKTYYAYITQSLQNPDRFNITIYTQADYDKGMKVKHQKRSRDLEEKRIAEAAKKTQMHLMPADITIADIGLDAPEHEAVINKNIRELTARGNEIVEVEGLEGFDIYVIGNVSDQFIDQESGQRAHAGGISTVGSKSEVRRLWITRGYYEQQRAQAINCLRHEAIELDLWWESTRKLLKSRQIRAPDDTVTKLPAIREWVSQNIDLAQTLHYAYHHQANERYPVEMRDVPASEQDQYFEFFHNRHRRAGDIAPVRNLKDRRAYVDKLSKQNLVVKADDGEEFDFVITPVTDRIYEAFTINVYNKDMNLGYIDVIGNTIKYGWPKSDFDRMLSEDGGIPLAAIGTNNERYKGLGRALMTYAMRIAKGNGYNKFVCMEANEDALKFYRDLGFTGSVSEFTFDFLSSSLPEIKIVRKAQGDITIADIGLDAPEHEAVINRNIRKLTARGNEIVEVEGLEEFEIHVIGNASDQFIDEKSGQRAHAGGISTVGSKNEVKRLWIAKGYYKNDREEALYCLRHEAVELDLWWQKTEELLEAGQVRPSDDTQQPVPNRVLEEDRDAVTDHMPPGLNWDEGYYVRPSGYDPGAAYSYTQYDPGGSVGYYRDAYFSQNEISGCRIKDFDAWYSLWVLPHWRGPLYFQTRCDDPVLFGPHLEELGFKEHSSRQAGESGGDIIEYTMYVVYPETIKTMPKILSGPSSGAVKALPAIREWISQNIKLARSLQRQYHRRAADEYPDRRRVVENILAGKKKLFMLIEGTIRHHFPQYPIELKFESPAPDEIHLTVKVYDRNEKLMEIRMLLGRHITTLIDFDVNPRALGKPMKGVKTKRGPLANIIYEECIEPFLAHCGVTVLQAEQGCSRLNDGHHDPNYSALGFQLVKPANLNVPWDTYVVDEYEKDISYARARMPRLPEQPRKCLVLDCDGVLWGGTVGEDGPQGIVLNKHYLNFQRRIRALKERGVILVLNSKNDPQDVEAVFEQHPNMPLKRNDFAAVRINWQDKATNIRGLARELNIGTDSMVFLDDTPEERLRVASSLPEVFTPDLPQAPSRYAAFLDGLGIFKTGTVTEEAARRTELYAARERRVKLQKETFSQEEYFKSLGLQAVIGRAQDQDIPRISEITKRTNQFNPTTRRYEESDIARFMQDTKRCRIYTMRLQDRFGDMGIVGIMIIRKESQGAWGIDTFCMSCRAIGLTAENTFVGYVVDELKRDGCRCLYGTYIPTERNVITKDLYERLGFKLIKTEPSGQTEWKLDLQASSLEISPWIEVLPKDRPGVDGTPPDVTIADIGVEAGEHEGVVNRNIRELVSRGDEIIRIEGLQGFEIHVIGNKSDMFIDEETGQRAHAGGISTVGGKKEVKRLWIARGYYEKERGHAVNRLRHEAVELDLWCKKTKELLGKHEIRAPDDTKSTLPTIREWIAKTTYLARIYQNRYHETARASYPLESSETNDWDRYSAAVEDLKTALERNGMGDSVELILQHGVSYSEHVIEEYGYRAIIMAIRKAIQFTNEGINPYYFLSNPWTFFKGLSKITSVKVEAERWKSLAGCTARNRFVLQHRPLNLKYDMHGGVNANTLDPQSYDNGPSVEALDKWIKDYVLSYYQGPLYFMTACDDPVLYFETLLKNGFKVVYHGEGAGSDGEPWITDVYKKEVGQPSPSGKAPARSIKCIVVDGDNTLWGGVIDEIGRENVRIGGRGPSEAYELFQLWLKELKEKHGVMLALCTRNSPEDVQWVLRDHPGMILKESDFVAISANYGDKAANIRAIAEQIGNLGLESLVFIDDDPRQRMHVSTEHPAVATMEFSDEPRSLGALMDAVEAICPQTAPTASDQVRTGYIKEVLTERDALRKASRTEEEFYGNLGTRITVYPATEKNIPRLAQLTQRTNQFNLTAARHTEEEIRGYIDNLNYRAYCLEYADRFGDAGDVVGLIILKNEGKGTWAIDTFCMSCRILDLTVENAFITSVVSILKDEKAKALIGRYVPTDRNTKYKTVYGSLGFKAAGKAVGTQKRAGAVEQWELGLAQPPMKAPLWIKVIGKAEWQKELKKRESHSAVADIGSKSVTLPSKEEAPTPKDKGSVANCIKDMHNIGSPITAEELERVRQKSATTVRTELEMLKALDLLIIEGRGVRGDPYKYALHPMLKALSIKQIDSICAIEIELNDRMVNILDRYEIPGNLIPQVQSKIMETFQNIIHEENLDLTPAVPQGKILWHVIVNELIPEEQQRMGLITQINQLFKRTESSERIKILNKKEKLEDVLAELSRDPNNIVHVALNDENKVKEMPKGVKMVVFKGEMGNYIQLEGMMAVSRALSIEDIAVRNDKLLRMYKLLTGEVFSGKLPATNDPQELALSIIFNLPKIIITDYNELKRLNNSLKMLIESA